MSDPRDIRILLHASSNDAELLEIADKVLTGERITPAEGIVLYEKASLGFAGTLADHVRTRMHGNIAYFNRNFHIEPTNLCVFDCKFCSYSRMLKQRSDGWVMSKESMMDIVRSYADKQVTEVHIVGGVLPELNLEWFADVLSSIKAMRPDLHIKGFTAVELEYMIRKAKMSYRDGLAYLQKAGLDSLPGGGAEIFDETIREQICADKCDSATWLEIHRCAHELGMHSNATILYGHIESFAHRIDHMERLRSMQDETKGFNCFIPLKFRNQHNQMSNVEECSVVEDMRNYAIARIYLDNFPHIKAYWPMIGREQAQLSLHYGVNDIDGTIDDTTKIYSMAGAEEQSPVMTTRQICELILAAGKQPVERDTLYNHIKSYSHESLDAEFGVDGFIGLPVAN
ncbi:MAG TPA: aminofutalosine synthase MqnE [Chitinophagales bacterium]|nr:aminofutalosine synthase MqnE [Chitinophagales bacterium]HNI54819.1 aminofutalosine synthase MqnE [Chitinophagales bacterium]HNK97162.1 aminofutalosine synthase MqnE [Chitinophagales bacterium]HNM09379.1 aminofutalosine synthase MqnE [Chitinophagales bacterium]HNM30547.1 aminofutalosine synthase MqnE [Chitinophagales bacterium]